MRYVCLCMSIYIGDGACVPDLFLCMYVVSIQIDFQDFLGSKILTVLPLVWTR